MSALAIGFPFLLAAVLAFSAAGKLRTPDDLDGWRELGVPKPLQQTWLLRVHPWLELVLAAALVLLGGILGVLAACAAVALMVAYTVLVVRAVRRPEDASCACFGERTALTGRTVARNVWLLALAVATLAVIGANPLAGGAVAASVAAGAGWLVVACAAVVTVVLVSRAETHETTPDAAALVPAEAADDELLDYLRARTPAVPVTTADGTLVNLRTLAAQKPILLLAVSPTCGACTPVIDAIGRYRELLPEVDVRFLLTSAPNQSPLTDVAEPQSLHDPHGYVRGSISDWPTPTAVLLGMDGMLAGGPESGTAAIEAFVGDIYENLNGVRPDAAASVME